MKLSYKSRKLKEKFASVEKYEEIRILQVLFIVMYKKKLAKLKVS